LPATKKTIQLRRIESVAGAAIIMIAYISHTDGVDYGYCINAGLFFAMMTFDETMKDT
jgi:hypothetical protein